MRIAILAGLCCAAFAGAARADSVSRDPATCDEKSESHLDGIGPGGTIVEVPVPAPPASETYFEGPMVLGCSVMEMSALTSFNPWFELPGDPKSSKRGSR